MAQSVSALVSLAALLVAASAAGPCCKTCTAPFVKYYSVDRAHGFCGDACMDPKKFAIYKKFEPNLTLVDESHPDCSGQYTPVGTFYTDYDSTVTHGDPFGILSVTLDLYAPTGMPDHSCCSTPLPGNINCFGKPKSMTIMGTGPYCCPSTATEKTPCPKEAAPAPAFDSTCAKPGKCGLAYQACCAASIAKGYPCGCHLKNGTGASASDCGTCGTAFSACCLGFKAMGYPCTCDIGDGWSIIV